MEKLKFKHTPAEENKINEEARLKPRVKLDFMQVKIVQKYRNAFGMYTGSQHYDVSQMINFIEDKDPLKPVIAYPVGRHIGMRNIVTNEMKFIRQPEIVKEITAMALAPNKKFIAICEKHVDDKSAYLSFYDMKNMYFKPIKMHINVCDQTTPANHKYVTSINFSADSKYVTCLLNAPDCKALAYDWFHKSRVISQFDFHKQNVTKITFHPRDSHQVMMSGEGIFQKYSMQEGSFRDMPSFKGLPKPRRDCESVTYSDHCWTPDDLLLGCSNSGDLFAIEAQEVLWTIQKDKSLNFTQIQSYPMGFAIGSDQGMIKFYEKETDKISYTLLRSWTNRDLKTSKIMSMSYHESSQSQKILAIATNTSNVVYLNLMGQIYNQDSKLKSIIQEDDDNLTSNDISNENILYDLLGNGFHSESVNQMSVSIQRPILATMSKEDCTIRLWNYMTGKCELAREYFALDRASNSMKDAVKPLCSVAIHPSGYYMAAGFIDKVRMFHVLHNELREYINKDIRNCTNVMFSNTGQYFLCHDAKYLYVYSSFMMDNYIFKYKSPTPNLSHVQFSQDDSAISVVSTDGFLQRFDLLKDQPIGDGTIDRTSDFWACHFLPGQSAQEKYQVLVSGSDDDKGAIKIVNTFEETFVNFKFDSCKRVTTICQIDSFYKGVTNLVIGTDNGHIKIISHDPEEIQAGVVYDDFSAHVGPVNRVMTSPDGRYVFSCGADGCVFVYGVTEMQDEKNMFKQIDPNQKEIDAPPERIPDVVDADLGGIVLIEKSLMEDWRTQQEQLKTETEEEKEKVDHALKGEKVNYQRQRLTIQNTKDQQLEDLKNLYQSLQAEEAEQKDENTQTMKKMELNHLQCMEELQTLYEKKLSIENANFVRLEKVKAKEQDKYEVQIKELQLHNERAIEDLLNEFKLNLQKVQDEYEDSKKTANDLKITYEEKLNQQEDEHEEEIVCMKTVSSKDKTLLEEVIGNLENDIKTINRQIKRILEEKANFQQLKLKFNSKEDHLKQILAQKKMTIEQLEYDKREVQEKLKNKENELYKYKFKIKDLQKTKSVLTHRTQEMKASLEPKEQQIESIKENLLDLEKVFDHHQKRMNSMNVELDKKQKEITDLQNSLFNEKNQTKQEEKTIQSFVNEIHKIVQDKDESEYAEGLRYIYKTYVKKFSEDILDKKKRDPETIEELDRQLRYMEKSIGKLKSNTQQNESKTKQNIKNKTSENANLIVDLQSLRQSRKKLEQKLQKKILKTQELKLLLSRKTREDRKISSSHAGSRQNYYSAMDNQGKPPVITRPKTGNYMSQMQARKGRLHKGTPFNYFSGNQDGRQRMAELNTNLEDNNKQIFLQKLEIRALKDQVIKMLVDLGHLNEDEKHSDQISSHHFSPIAGSNSKMMRVNSAHRETLGLDSRKNI